MKKKLCCLIAMLMLCSGCSSMGSIDHDNLDMDKVFTQINENIERGEWSLGYLQDDDMDEETLLETYGLSAADVEEYRVRPAVIPASCGEVAIFHLKDEDSLKVEEAVRKRIEGLVEDMNALEAQKKILNAYQTMKVGRYFLFAAGIDAQKVIQYISSL